jgi:SpoVK/Ycf46/Vps4 family AAA+-type ATPase
VAGRDLKALIAAYRDRDDLSFRRAAQSIIEEEEAKRHTVLAKDLRRLLASGSGFHTPVDSVPTPEPPRNRETDLPLAEVVAPIRSLESLVLNAELYSMLDEISHEVSRWPELDVSGIPRRRSLLLFGPPGCGKTSIAEAMATSLSRSLVIVRTETVISSYLGETASNISKIFDYANSAPYVILFDEFDAIGKTRDDSSDHGELRRIVNAVLQLIDRYRGPSIIVAATNHQEVLDSALWRRFAEVLEVPLPDATDRGILLKRTLMNRVEPKADINYAVEALDGLPHAAVERVGVDALRLSLLAKRSIVSSADLLEAVRRTLRRRWL